MGEPKHGTSHREPSAMSRYLNLLGASTARAGSLLCVGIDPVPSALPVTFRESHAGIERWIDTLIAAAMPHAAAFKMNLAYFEALGSEGMRLAEHVRRQIPAEIPLIVDAKRGDIGATVVAQGVALFDVLGADAVTANPYLGIGALAPFLDRTDRFTYLLCRTSNPESAELQSLRVGASDTDPEETLAERVARLAGRRAEGVAGRIGLVVGATDAAALRQVRAAAPGLPLLVPGVGAQGGEANAVTADGGATTAPGSGVVGRGLLVNVGRGISDAGVADERVEEALGAAAAEWGRRLAILAP
ncbi:MAG: orotidine-5'-phosphate decarboxylase [Candidatus Aquidulcis sp.]|jgi:orotidine-5'-phosphate decarboxylase|nr:MAG: orotidine-5'-phosphate decarboxylase [Candidatus Aquidulcis sp.]